MNLDEEESEVCMVKISHFEEEFKVTLCSLKIYRIDYLDLSNNIDTKSYTKSSQVKQHLC